MSDANAGQTRTEAWTAAGSLSMDAFQFLTSISGHITPETRADNNTLLTVVGRGERGLTGSRELPLFRVL